MKMKFFFASLLVMGATFAGFAQGISDGIEFYKIGDTENAKTLLDRNMSSASNIAEAYYYYGQIAFDEGNLSEAQSYYDKAVAANPSYPYSYVGQGAILLKNGNKGAAENLFKQARKLTKKNSKLEIAIARAYYAANPTAYDSQIKKCVKDAQKWNQKDPDSYNFEGDRFSDLQMWGDAAAQYEWAMTYEPSNIEATVKFANTYFKVAPDLAIEKLREIDKTQSASALVQRQIAEKLYEHGDFEEAAQRYGNYITSTVNHFPKDEARYAQLLYVADKFQQAYDVAAKLKTSVPAGSSYSFIADRLMLYSASSLKNWDAAVKVGQEFFGAGNAANAQNYNAQDYIKYATSLDAAGGHAEEAIVAYDKAIELDPNNLDLVRRLAIQYAQAKQFDKAIMYENKVLTNENSVDGDKNAMAEIYIMQAEEAVGDAKTAALANAMTYINQALEGKPENLTYLYNKSLIEMQMESSNTGKALGTMQKLVNVIKSKDDITPYKPTLGYAYSYIALYYYGAKNYSKALDAFTSWQEIDPTNTNIANAIEQLSKVVK